MSRQREAEKLEFGTWPLYCTFPIRTLNFRSDVARGSNRRAQAVLGINGIARAKNSSDSATSNSITAIANGDLETLGSTIATSVMKIQHGNFRKRVFNEEEKALKQSRLLTVRQIAWMIQDHF